MISRFLRKGVLIALSVVMVNSLIVTANAADYTTQGWSKKINISLNSTSTGANVAGNVANFPILIRLTSSNFTFSEAKNDGSDVRFTKSNFTVLSYEIDRWDATNQLADIWVKVDTVYGNLSTQKIVMYWGNSSAASESNSSAVFDVANGYLADWHFKETGTTTRADATTNHYDATPVKYTGNESKANGLIGRYDSLDQRVAGGYMTLPTITTPNFTQGITVSVWLWPDNYTTYAPFLNLNDSANASSSQVLFCTNGAQNAAILLVNNSGSYPSITGANFSPEVVSISTKYDTTWFEGEVLYINEINDTVYAAPGWNQLVAVIAPPSAAKIYKNGALVASGTIPVPSNATRRSSWIGKGYGDSTLVYHGKIDEMSLANTARSEDWIKLSYQNQRKTQALVTVGDAIVSVNPIAGKSRDGSGFLVQQTPGSLKIRYSLTNNNARAVKVNVCDALGRSVWEKLSYTSGPGVKSISWNYSGTRSPLVKGVYFVRLSTIDARGDVSAIFEKRLVIVSGK